VQVLYGGDEGLVATGNQVWTENSPGVPGQANGADGFGFALAAGKYEGSGKAGLAVGANTQNVRSAFAAGAVVTFRRSPSGLTATGSRFWSQNTPGLPDSAETGDGFGYAASA